MRFHDGTEMLSRWGLLSQDTLLAGRVRIMSVALMVWTVYRAWQTPDESRTVTGPDSG